MEANRAVYGLHIDDKLSNIWRILAKRRVVLNVGGEPFLILKVVKRSELEIVIFYVIISIYRDVLGILS